MWSSLFALRRRPLRRPPPRLEHLEDRVTPTSADFIGYLRGDFAWNDLAAWEAGGTSLDQIAGATVPGAGDTATLPGISSAPNTITAPPSLGTLVMNGSGATGMSVVASGSGLTLTNGLEMHGGFLFGGNVIIKGASSWDGGTIGQDGEATTLLLTNGTLDILNAGDGGVNLERTFDVGTAASGDNAVCTIDGTTVYSDVGSSSVINVRTNARLSLSGRPNSYTPVGSFIQFGNHTDGKITVDGTLTASASCGPPGGANPGSVASEIDAHVVLNAGSLMMVMSRNALTINSWSASSWADDYTGSGDVAIGLANPSDTSDGHSTLTMGNGVFRQSAGEVDVYGSGNTLALPGDAGTASFAYFGTSTLALMPQLTTDAWEYTTLDITGGRRGTGFTGSSVVMGSVFEFWAKHDSSATNGCICDKLTSQYNMAVSTDNASSGLTADPHWADTADTVPVIGTPDYSQNAQLNSIYAPAFNITAGFVFNTVNNNQPPSNGYVDVFWGWACHDSGGYGGVAWTG